jgi:flagellar protein FlbD
MEGAARSSIRGSTTVIWVTRLNGTEMVINSDLVESLESTPDTVLMLVDGKRYVVAESAAEIVARIRAFRASILSLLDQPAATASPASSPAPNLYVLPTDSRG